MVEIQNLVKAAQNPDAVVRELHRIYYGWGNQKNWNPEGINIFDEDWDNLVLLDACRFDLFREEITDHSIHGTLESRISRGAATYEFIPGNFAGRRLHDVVYITANSWFLKLRNEIDAEVHHVIDVSQEDLGEEYFDKDTGALLPNAVTDYAIQAASEYPDKRLLIHYPRPHHPFIGPFGKRAFPTTSSSLREVLSESDNVSPENVRRAYRENLDIVLEEVADLLEHLSGKSIISADHGEMLGERYSLVPMRGYGHHKGIYNNYLVNVPWLIIETGRRRDIESEPPTSDDSINMDNVDQRLKDMGYRVE